MGGCAAKIGRGGKLQALEPQPAKPQKNGSDQLGAGPSFPSEHSSAFSSERSYGSVESETSNKSTRSSEPLKPGRKKGGSSSGLSRVLSCFQRKKKRPQHRRQARRRAVPPVALFRDCELMTKQGLKDSKALLEDKKAVIIFFGAGWNKACKRLTAVMANAYREYVGGDIEVVFVSSDKSEQPFQEFFEEMPWTALPYEDFRTMNKLFRKFEVKEFPTLVAIGADGNLLSKDARKDVMECFNLGTAMHKWGLAPMPEPEEWDRPGPVPEEWEPEEWEKHTATLASV